MDCSRKVCRLAMQKLVSSSSLKKASMLSCSLALALTWFSQMTLRIRLNSFSSTLVYFKSVLNLYTWLFLLWQRAVRGSTSFLLFFLRLSPSSSLLRLSICSSILMLAAYSSSLISYCYSRLSGSSEQLLMPMSWKTSFTLFSCIMLSSSFSYFLSKASLRVLRVRAVRSLDLSLLSVLGSLSREVGTSPYIEVHLLISVFFDEPNFAIVNILFSNQKAFRRRSDVLVPIYTLNHMTSHYPEQSQTTAILCL